MSEKYYQDISTNKDIIKFQFQLGAILLKSNKHSSNILNSKNNIVKLDTDIKINDKDIKSNYDSNSSSLTDIDRKIYNKVSITKIRY